ncbi:MAG: hypothetical protein AAGF84_04795 [Planctomycetota bacterium]
MTPETAELVVVASAVIAATVWLVALVLAWRSRRGKAVEPIEQTLSRRRVGAVRDALGRASALMTPPWDLVGGESEYALFDVPHAGPGRSRVCVRVEPDPDSDPDFDAARVTCSTEPTRMSPWLWWPLVALLVAIPICTAVAVHWAWGHAQTAANDASRVQVIQMMQLVHLLWPPFLLLGFRHITAKQLRQQMQRFTAALDLTVPTEAR